MSLKVTTALVAERERAATLAPEFSWALYVHGDLPELIGHTHEQATDLRQVAATVFTDGWHSGEFTDAGYRFMFGEASSPAGTDLAWQIAVLDGPSRPEDRDAQR